MIVEAASAFDTEAFGHGDLHAADVVAVPQRLQHGVGEPQMQDVLHRQLAQEAIDPVQLRFCEDRAQHGVQFLRGLQVVTKGFLDHHPGVLRQTGRGQTLHNGAEQRWRSLEVEHRRRRRTDGLADRCERCGIREVTPDVGHALAQAVQDIRVRLSVTQRGRHRLRRTLAQVRISPVLRGNPDDRTRQKPAPLQLIQRHERHLPSQIAADTERHEHVSLPRVTHLLRHQPSTPIPDLPRMSLCATQPPRAAGGNRPGPCFGVRWGRKAIRLANTTDQFGDPYPGVALLHPVGYSVEHLLGVGSRIRGRRGAVVLAEGTRQEQHAG